MQTAPGILDPDSTANLQSRIQAHQDALSYPARAARQKLMNAIAAGDPQAIQEGVTQGLLAFSPEQQTKIRQLREAMAQLDIDPSLSPAQRAIGERGLAEKLNAIRPMEVPSDQQPIDPIEQFHQNTITMPHPTLGIPVTRQRVVRNGEEKWEETKESLEDIKAEHARRAKQLEAENPAHIEEAKAKRAQAETETRRKIFDAKIAAHAKVFDLKTKLVERKQAMRDAQLTPQKEDDEETKKAVKEAEDAISTLESEIENFDRAMPSGSAGQTPAPDPQADAMAEMGIGGDQPADVSQPATDQSGDPEYADFMASQPDQQQSSDINPTQDMEAMSLPPVELHQQESTSPGPNGMSRSTLEISEPLDPMTGQPVQQAPQVLSPHDDGPQQWQTVPIGGTTTLPDGTPVRKTGPNSYVRL
jgi:hypothetical protein